MGSRPLQAGVGSAVNDTTRSRRLGVAIIGSVASSLFASRLHSFLAHVPAHTAAQAKASVGAAVTIGSHTRAGRTGLVDAARQAFVSGTDRAVLVAAAAALVGSLVAIRFLRPGDPRRDGPGAGRAGRSVTWPCGVRFDCVPEPSPDHRHDTNAEIWKSDRRRRLGCDERGS